MKPTTLILSNIAWDFVWQRHQTLATLFARDSDVVFCELPGTRRVGWRDLGRVVSRLRVLSRPAPAPATLPPGLRVVRPWVVPATNGFFHWCNRRLIERFLRTEPALAAGVDCVVTYSAARSALRLIERVPHRRLIYDCTDNWQAVAGIPRCLPDDERRLLAAADLTLVPSRRLETLHGSAARRLVRLPHGALVDRFLVPAKPRASDGSLTLLYYGHLHAQHLDFAAIDAVARARPGWKILLVGPVKTAHSFAANVELAGQQPHEALREFVGRADVLLLPYALNDYTRSVLPAKTFECLATGRPIVAAPLPELIENFAAWMEFAATPDEWVPAIERAAAAGDQGAPARVELAQANTWERRYERLRELLAALP